MGRKVFERRAAAVSGMALLVVALMLSTGLAQPGGPAHDEALLAALRAGGFNIYFRHAATDWAQRDDVRGRGDWRSCDAQRMRQLSAAGRTSARSVGAAMRKLAIPVRRIVASPYCRTMQTAELMDLGPVSATDAVINMRVADFFGGRDAVTATASRLLGTETPRGFNTLIVAHGNVALATFGFRPAEGEAVIVQPLAGGRYEIAGRLTAEALVALSEQVAAGSNDGR